MQKTNVRIVSTITRSMAILSM